MTMTSTWPDSSSDQNSNSDALLNKAGIKTLAQRKEEAELLTWAMNEYHRCKRARQSVEKQWYINLAFYFGKQNIQVITGNTSATGFQLHVPKAPAWRVRMVINKIRPIIRTELAKLTASKPTFTVTPATTEDEDVAAARVAENIVSAAYKDKNFHKVVRQTCWWGSICGTSFIKIYWDPKSPPVGQSMTPGDTCIERVDPFHIFIPDLLEEDMEKQPYVIHATTKDPAYLQQAYGVSVPANVKSTDDLLEDSFLNMIGAQQENNKKVLCLEFWIKPGCHPAFPEGGLLTICGGKIIQNTGVISYDEETQQKTGGYPYDHGEYPFAKFEHVPTGKFYADSVVTDLIGPQREFNRTRSQIIEAKNLMAKPKLLAARGSVNPRQITSEPGQTILYTPGFDAPRPLEMAPLPSYVLQEVDRLQQDMDDISGQHEISRGQNPSQVTAATALSFLQEQDESKLAYSISSIEEMVEKVGRHYLKFVVQYWDVPRMVRVTGSDGAFEAKMWQGSDLRGNIDIRVEAGSALPKSKAAKQAFLMDVFKMGAIEAPMFLELLDLGGIEKAYEDFLVDKRQAQRENFKLTELENDPQFIMTLQMQQMQGPSTPVMDETGQQLPTDDPMTQFELPANSYDNHQMHITLHNAFRKSQKFEMLPDEIKALFEHHVTMHQITLQQGMMAQMPDGSTGPVIGGPPGTGGPPGQPMDPNAQAQQQAGGGQPAPPQGDAQGGLPNG